MENTYEKIAALVPEGEHFDATAINEGVYLTTAHIANIEVSLLNQDTVVAEMQTQLDAAKQQNETSQQTIADRDASLESKDAQITALEAEVATLKTKPAADFTEKGKEKDEHGSGEQKQLDPVTIEANKKREAMGLPLIK